MNELNNIIIGYSYEWIPKVNKNYNNKEIKKIKDEDIKLKHIKEIEKTIEENQKKTMEIDFKNSKKLAINLFGSGIMEPETNKKIIVAIFGDGITPGVLTK